MDNNQLLPLVTVCVVTYNSEDFILETLESIKNQTYKNFELIISDDGSSDNTLTVAKKWLEKNDKYFVRTHVVSTEKILALQQITTEESLLRRVNGSNLLMEMIY